MNIDIVQILLHALNLVILTGGLTLILYKPVRKFLVERRAYYEERERVYMMPHFYFLSNSLEKQ